MSITLEGGGTSQALPQGWIITNENQASRIPRNNFLRGRRGAVLRTDGSSMGSKLLTVQGTVRAESGSALATAMDDWSKVVGTSTRFTLTESYMARTCYCHLMNLVQTKGRGDSILVQLVLLNIDGTWQDSLTTSPVQTTQTITSSDGGITVRRQMSVTYAGSAPTSPQIMIEPATTSLTPSVTFKGRNMVQNSSMDAHTDLNVAPDNWTARQGTPRWIQHAGHEDNFCVELKGDSGVEDQFATEFIPLDEGVRYTLSWYALRIDNIASPDSDLKASWDWKEDDGTTDTSANSVFTQSIVSKDEWTRYENTIIVAGHAGDTAGVIIFFKCDLPNRVFLIDDVQLEEAASSISPATSYVNTSLPRHKHRTISRSDSVGSGEAWLIDCDQRLARYRDATAWNLDGALLTGDFFEFLPGVNHLFFDSVVVGATAYVTVHHRNYYL